MYHCYDTESFHYFEARSILYSNVADIFACFSFFSDPFFFLLFTVKFDLIYFTCKHMHIFIIFMYYKYEYEYEYYASEKFNKGFHLHFSTTKQKKTFDCRHFKRWILAHSPYCGVTMAFECPLIKLIIYLMTSQNNNNQTWEL